MNSSLFFLVLALSCVLIEAFFSMFEMACVSFNKVRLQYYVSKNFKRAKWLQFLLNNPSYLFGTTLIAVNTVLQIGSESARRFYESLNISPDYAPLTQIFLVVVFGELAPLFAARRHSEYVSMMSVPVIYFLSKVFTPLIWIIQGISKVANKVFGKSENSLFLTKEELQKAFEEKTKKSTAPEENNIDSIVSNIFSLKNKVANQAMLSLESANIISSDCTLKEMMNLLSVNYSPFIPIYHHTKFNVVGIAYPRDLFMADENDRVIDHAHPPWFITEKTSILQILKQFRHNNQSVSIVLDNKGKAVGILTLDQIIDEIFGDYSLYYSDKKFPLLKSVIERTLPGDMLISEFNEQFDAHLQYENAETLSDLINAVLDHHPSEGEVIHIDQFELIVLEPSLLGAKTISVRTVI